MLTDKAFSGLEFVRAFINRSGYLFTNPHSRKYINLRTQTLTKTRLNHLINLYFNFFEFYFSGISCLSLYWRRYVFSFQTELAVSDHKISAYMFTFWASAFVKRYPAWGLQNGVSSGPKGLIWGLSSKGLSYCCWSIYAKLSYAITLNLINSQVASSVHVQMTFE
mgnify:CR=1 FL=1